MNRYSWLPVLVMVVGCGGGTKTPPATDLGVDLPPPDVLAEFAADAPAGEEIVPDVPAPDGRTEIEAGGCVHDSDCVLPDGSGPCLVGRCDRVTGTCAFEPAPDGTKCDGGNLCVAGTL